MIHNKQTRLFAAVLLLALEFGNGGTLVKDVHRRSVIGVAVTDGPGSGQNSTDAQNVTDGIVCPHSCDCAEGSNLPFPVQPFFVPVRHIYCVWTNTLVNFTEVMGRATQSENIKTQFDIHIKCYGETDIIWTSSTFLKRTFAMRMFNCNIINDESVLFPIRTSLKVLVMDTLNSADVEKFLFQGLQSLIIFAISNSNLTKLPSIPLIPSLLGFSVEGNDIDINCAVFNKPICLMCSMDFTFNHITALPHCEYQEISRSKPTYYFKNNSINDTGNIGGINAVRLDLSYNDVSVIPNITSKNLLYLLLSYNNIENVHSHSFPVLLYLLYLDLSHNKISSIETASFSNLFNLKDLYLQGNRLLVFDQRHIPATWSNVHINIQNNNLLYPPFSDDGNIPANKQLKIESGFNPYNCDCKLKEFLATAADIGVYTDKDMMKCHQPPRYQNESIFQTNMTNTCPVLTRCPVSCQCDYDTTTFITTVDCSNKNLQTLPLVLPEGTLALNFSSNRLTVLDTRDYLSQTTVLDLSNNSITNVTSSALTLLSNVQTLNLQRNLITVLPRSITNSSFSNDTVIYLSNNRWMCSCELLWFPEWLRGVNSLIADKQNLKCHLLSPDLAVRDATSDTLNCPSPGSANINLIISLTVLAIVFIIVTVLALKFRFAVKALMYNRLHMTFLGPTGKFGTLLKHKEHDVYVVYHEENHEWAKILLNRLEKTEIPPYRTLVGERDFVVGNTMDENAAYAVTNCHTALFVFSEDFIKSEWCLFYFHCAYEYMLREKDMKVVVVRADKLDINHLDSDLQAYFKSHTYLDVDDILFWDKLLYILPKQQLQINNP